jgi:uncharacterized membrane protein
MAICNQCGKRINDGVAFCASCGAPIASLAGAGASSAAAPALAQASISPNVAGVLAYLFGLVSGIVFLVLDPYKSDGFVRFHAFQSIFFAGLWIAGGIAWDILFAVISSVSSWLALIGGFLSLLLMMGGFFYWIFLMYKAYKGQRYMIPVIGRIAAQQANR